jgi:serine/threonine protein kinase
VSQAPDPADPLIGVIVGNYEIKSKIGAGGMGAVYLAMHPGIGRKVAVKVLLPEHSKRQDLTTRFFNEAKATATLRHPALIEVFDYGFLPDGAGYLVMDFLEGESLAARLSRVAPLPADTAAEIGRQLAAGVAVAHANGIVHRDLKPDNIFLVPDPELATGERVKILDFGIAKLLLPGASGSKGATSTGMLIGTPLYMAPEQCRGAGLVDHRADVYSAGCILYEMLAGRPPFNYEGVGEILAAHLHQTAAPLHQIDPGIPEPLEAIVMTALQKDPAARQQQMAHLAAQLQQFLRQLGGQQMASTTLRPSGALHIPAPTPAPSWSRASSASASPSVSPSASRSPAGSGVRAAPVPGTGAGPLTGGAPGNVSANHRGSVATAPTTFSAAASQASTPPPPLAPAPKSSAPLVFAAVGLLALVSAGGLFWLRSRAAPESAPAIAAAPPPAAAPPATTPPTAVPPAATPPPAVPPVAESPPPAPAQPSEPQTPPAAAVPATAAADQPAPGTAGADAALDKVKPAAAIAKPPARSAGRAQYEQAFNHRAAGEEDKALLAYRAALRAGGLSSSERADAETMVINLGRKYGEIEVMSGVVGATISVDGRARGRTPLREPILVRPGTHVITLELAGYQPRTNSVTVGPGEKKFISLKPAR